MLKDLQPRKGHEGARRGLETSWEKGRADSEKWSGDAVGGWHSDVPIYSIMGAGGSKVKPGADGVNKNNIVIIALGKDKLV